MCSQFEISKHLLEVALQMNPTHSLAALAAELQSQAAIIKEGGGAAAIERQHQKGRLTARERITQLLDPDSPSLELGLWAGWDMYMEWGGAASAGVVTTI